jgi:hypothetical protein
MKEFISTAREGGGTWFQSGKAYETELDEYIVASRTSGYDADSDGGLGLASRVRDGVPDGNGSDFVVSEGGEGDGEGEGGGGREKSDAYASIGPSNGVGGIASSFPSSWTYAHVAIVMAMTMRVGLLA